MRNSLIPNGAKVWLWHNSTLFVVEVVQSYRYLPGQRGEFYLYDVRTDFQAYERVPRGSLYLLIEEREALLSRLRGVLRRVNEYCEVVKYSDESELKALPLESVEA